jgi:2-polyprenyl-3-methyl-5-hydroxy-6-metoxy-1,4-benzoquinol methylase
MGTVNRCDSCGAALQGAATLAVTTTGGHRVAYARCPDCTLLQMLPLPSPTELASFYDEAYYGLGETKFAGWMEAVRGVCLRRRARRVYPLVTGSPLRVCDVGAGDGRFLKAMQARGCHISGTELPGAAYNRAAQVPEIHLVAGDVTEAGFAPGDFHVVTLWHVLEHMVSPAASLRCCHQLLKNAGVLVVEVPNLGSWQSRLSGPHAFHLDPPRHLYQFTDQSLQSLLEACGFEITRRETTSLEMGILGATQSWLNRLIKPRDLFYDMLRTRNRCAGGSGSKLASLLLAMVLLPVATLFTLLEAACGQGPVLRLFCRKKHGDGC